VNGMRVDTRIEQAVRIALGPVTLDGDLVVPLGAGGIVLFAHGSGSSRRSPRNRYVAGQVSRRLRLARAAVRTPRPRPREALCGAHRR
jgi:putative phosphoribosyl transferase